MSTTITYKGNTLATVSNATKTLKTAGKYMEDDVQLTDVSGGTAAISVVDTTDTHGGTIREITALDISDTTAVASDVAQGKYFYTSAGVKTLGTGSGGTATIESLSITPSETAQTFNASGVDGYKPVNVSAISSTYVGSGVNRRNSSDITEETGVFTIPAGYYSEDASCWVPTAILGDSIGSVNNSGVVTINRNVTTAGYVSGQIGSSYQLSLMTLPTSAASSATSGYTSKATIGRSTAAQYINIPPGYNSVGAYYVISAVANGSATAPASISGTAASVSTGTNTLTLTKTVSVTPTVSAGYVSSGTAGNATVTLTASVTTKAAATITPTTTNQTIASGTYLTGTQTIAGDADLVGGNILSTANIFGVQGTVVVQNYYTGSSAPSSSTGSNGDLYLQS